MTTQHATLTKKDAATYGRALAVAEGFLIAAAQAQRLVTYGQLGDAILRATGHRVDGRTWGTFLGDLVEDSFGRHQAMLSAVVVRADALTPGEGLKRLAVDLRLVDQDEADATVVERLPWLSG